MTDTIIEAAYEVKGFIPKPRYRRVECDWLPAEEGSEPLWAEVRADLPFGFINDMPYGSDYTYADIWAAIAPHVRAWNALGYDMATGTYQPVPPPAEGGVEVFKWVDPVIGDWLGFVIKTTYRTATTNPKANSGSAKPAGGPSAANAPVSASSNRAKKSRPNQAG
jgi:hypothetical protein